jgi:hypothetical protein
MREATGNALLTMMMTSIIAIIMIFFVGSISYTKAYRIKNYIVNKIEENKGWNSTLRDDVDNYLKNAGYYVKSTTCPNVASNVNNCILVPEQGKYDYCVYSCISGSDVYYKVITYSKFEFPVVGGLVKFDVKGETETFNDFN